MAQKRQPAGETVKPNKFKFVYIEADLSEANFSELTSTIAQVMRPPAPARQIANGKPQTALQAGNEPGDAVEITDAEYEGVTEPAHKEELAGNGTEPKVQRPPRQKKPKPPAYLHDLVTDIDGFKQFAKEKAPDSKNQQYLVAMYWLKERGNSATANADKIYTCYKTADWSIGFNDWSQTFHNLVFSEHVRKIAKGEFAINPIGEEVVKAMNKDKA